MGRAGGFILEVPQDLRAQYLERRKDDIESCFNHFHADEFEFIEKVGHQLKGNGVTFGFPNLSKLGDELEQAVLNNNKQLIGTLLERIKKDLAAY